jgi:hypothetical protein
VCCDRDVCLAEPSSEHANYPHPALRLPHPTLKGEEQAGRILRWVGKVASDMPWRQRAIRTETHVISSAYSISEAHAWRRISFTAYLFLEGVPAFVGCGSHVNTSCERAARSRYGVLDTLAAARTACHVASGSFGRVVGLGGVRRAESG